jgi:hypothetical protein
LGDRLTIAQILTVYRWQGVLHLAEQGYDLWRLIRLLNPTTAAANEIRDKLANALVRWGREQLNRKLIQTYIEEVGLAAIDL